MVFAGSALAESGAAYGVGGVDSIVHGETGRRNEAADLQLACRSVGELLRLPAYDRTYEAVTGLVRRGLGMDGLGELGEGFAVQELSVAADIAPDLCSALQFCGDLVLADLEDFDVVARSTTDVIAPRFQ